MRGPLIDRLGKLLGRWLWPESCAHCLQDIKEESRGGLCRDCLHRKTRLILRPFCLACGSPLSGSRPECPPCRGKKRDCRPIVALYAYRDAAVSAIRAFKYLGHQRAALELGSAMGGRFSCYPELSDFEAAVPMPLHWRRMRERGYNQAELLARGFFRETGLPIVHALRRSRRTMPLVSLTREERMAAVSDAFEPALPASAIHGRRFLLIDDVATSTASLEECARTLRRAGAAAVGAYVLARQF